MKKILFLLFTIVGVSFPAHAKSNIQKSQDCTPEKGFTIQKDLSYPLFLAMQAMKEKGLDLNNYLITYSENITGPGIIRFNFSWREKIGTIAAHLMGTTIFICIAIR